MDIAVCAAFDSAGELYASKSTFHDACAVVVGTVERLRSVVVVIHKNVVSLARDEINAVTISAVWLTGLFDMGEIAFVTIFWVVGYRVEDWTSRRICGSVSRSPGAPSNNRERHCESRKRRKRCDARANFEKIFHNYIIILLLSLRL